MFRVALIGGGGVGKSMLAFALSRHLHKRGLNCSVVNLDPGCKHLNYVPVFDLRKYCSLDRVMKQQRLGPNGALKKVYELLATDEKLAAKISEAAGRSDVAIIDTAGSLELFLFEGTASLLKRIADAVIFVVDNEALKGEEDLLVLKTISAIQTVKYSKPTLTVINKADLVERAARSRRQHKLSLSRVGCSDAIVDNLKNLFEEIGKDQRIISVSALERTGLDELMDALNELRCECGDLS